MLRSLHVTDPIYPPFQRIPNDQWHGNSLITCNHCCTFFFIILYSKCPGDSNFNRIRCPDDAKTVGHQTCRKQNPQLWTKQKKLKFTPLTISPETAAIKWLLMMNLLSVQLESLQRKGIMRFDSALYMATYLSQNMVPLQSGCTGQHVCLCTGQHVCLCTGQHVCLCTGQHVCLLRWTEAWILSGNNSRLVHGTKKIIGHETTRTVL